MLRTARRPRLERARALIDLGAAPRRSRRHEPARDPLRLDLAHRCGAHALAERAQVRALPASERLQPAVTEETWPVWKRAYEGEPATRGEEAVVRLTALFERAGVEL